MLETPLNVPEMVGLDMVPTTIVGSFTLKFRVFNVPGSIGEEPFGPFAKLVATWSLFIADTSGGGISTVQSWGLQLDVVAVPEVETWIAAALAGMFGAFWVNRQITNGTKKD